MDFFEQQDKSRGKTIQLVFLFVLAVVLVILAVYAAVIFSVYLYKISHAASFKRSGFNWLDYRLFFWVVLATLLVVVLSSITKIMALAKGGTYIAESLGGRRVNTSTKDPFEKRLVNVVEEMAIASGVPVPQIYILDKEKSINAFAAGYSPSDAVIAVTTGCYKILSRDELQGVVAHEYSHILNGDMRLNIRLIGVLGGIMSIASIGYILLHSGSRSRKDNSQILAIGLSLYAIGYIGHLLGRLIQAAVCRQREFLADASAIQFTRNPDGIAGALKKIGGFATGSRIRSPASSDICHMFFGQAISSLFATHPPLIDRIRKIQPGFDGRFEKITITESRLEPDHRTPRKPEEDFLYRPVSQMAIDADSVVKQAGRIRPENVASSSDLLFAIPAKIKDELNDMLGAVAIVGVLLLDRDPEEKKRQIQALQQIATPELIRHIQILDKELSGLNPRFRLPLLDLAIPTLRMLSPGQYAKLNRYIDVLIEADNKLTIFEFSLKQIITHRLASVFNPKQQKIVYRNITPLIPDIECLLSKLAYVGHHDAAKIKGAFTAALAQLPLPADSLELLPENKVSFHALDVALQRFSVASPAVKRIILKACSHCILFDKVVSLEEAELLRAIAYSMDIPVPPFISKEFTE